MASSRPPYEAHIGGQSWSRGPVATFDTLTDARRWAESYGTTADYCHVYDSRGTLAAAYHRDRSGDGTRWHKGG